MNDFSTHTGRWRGEYELWFEPGEPASSSDSELVCQLDRSRNVVSLRYRWSIDGDTNKGMYLVGGDGSVAFTDSFHYAGGLMLCSPDDGRGVLGHWQHEGRTWGWRTLFETTSEELAVTALLVTPEGEETKASRARYVRH